MNRSLALFILASLTMTAWSPLAAAAEPEPTCENHGYIGQVSVTGQNTYCPNGACENHGVILLIGDSRSCHGDGHAVVGADDLCYVFGDPDTLIDRQPTAPAASESWGAGADRPACGVAQEPVCWTSRFACGFVKPLWDSSAGRYVDLVRLCQCQPGDPRCDGHLASLETRSEGRL